MFEPPVRNSGIQGGVLVTRMRVKSPNGGYYGPSDLFVGSKLLIYGRCYEMTEADEGSLAAMEAAPHEFPRADFLRVRPTVSL